MGYTLQGRGVELGHNGFHNLFWTLFIGRDVHREIRRSKGGQTAVKPLSSPGKRLFSMFMLALGQATEQRFFARNETEMVEVGINLANAIGTFFKVGTMPQGHGDDSCSFIDLLEHPCCLYHQRTPRRQVLKVGKGFDEFDDSG